MRRLRDILKESIDPNPVEVDAFHGSGKRFNEFQQSHARIPNDYMGGGVGYFTDNKNVAKTYAKSMSKYHKTGTPYIYHTKLKMDNVFDVDHNFTGDKLKHVLPEDPKEHENFARGAGLLPYGSDRMSVLGKLRSGDVSLSGHQVFKGLSRGGVDSAKARDHLIKKGYDGIRYNGGENMNMDTRHNVYMPYNAGSIAINKVTKLVKKPAPTQAS